MAVQPVYNWTPELAQRAAENGIYIAVPGNNLLLLAGAQQNWNNPATSDFIYHTNYRIAGRPADVTAALTQAGIDQNTIQQILTTAFSRNNYQTTLREQYQEVLRRERILVAEKLRIRAQTRIQIEIQILDNFIRSLDNTMTQIANQTRGDREEEIRKRLTLEAQSHVKDDLTKLRQDHLANLDNLNIDEIELTLH